jgi:PAP2 superfamily
MSVQSDAPESSVSGDTGGIDVRERPGQAGWRRLTSLWTRSWVFELGILAGLLVAYNIIRAGGGNDQTLAVGHAHEIFRLEGFIFEKIEATWNQWLLEAPAIAVAACYFYALMHYAVTPAILLVSRRIGGWQYWRGYWALIIACAIALVMYASYPVAPPRLVSSLGVVDTMQHFSEYGWWGDAASAPRGIGDATNQFAAMPSLHFGWSLWCGIQMWGFAKRPWRIAAVVYPSVQAFVVVATANHFVLDVLAGAAVVIAAYVIVEMVGRRWPRPELRDRGHVATS